MKSVTYLELIIAIIIIGVLATLSFIHYSIYREKVLDGEAKTNLVLIIAAEREYWQEQGKFCDSDNEALLNTNLRLFLPTLNKKWEYATTSSGPPYAWCAQATRAGTGKTWRLRSSETEPVEGGSCP